MNSPKTEEEKNSMLLDDLEKMRKILLDDLKNLSLDSKITSHGYSVNAEEYAVSESRISALKEIMEALTDPDIYMMGVYGKDDKHMASLLQRLIRRVRRDNLFGVIVMVSVRKKPNLRRIQEAIADEIQEEIADELGFSFQGEGQENKTAFCVLTDSNNKVVTENARQLSDRIRREPKILFILRDLQIRLDLAKLGIPFGMDHHGCKLILTSESEEIPSNQINTQRTFKF